ncbi:MAG: hypothetical protein V4724_20300 [Pseudomonadota bacterium]
MSRTVAAAALALLAGCGTLTEAPTQQVLVQTVLDHREVAGAGCVLSNEVGKWFVTTPARVTIRKSVSPLHVDCRHGGEGWAYEKFNSRENGTLWGNVVLTAGVGYLVDRNTGQGFDYPSVLTVVLRHAETDPPRVPPVEGVTVY